MDKAANEADNEDVLPTVEQTVRAYARASRKVMRENHTPQKARAFLLRAGILERHKGSPNGVRLAKRFR